ncbi:MAG: hypothetical protein WCW26_02345 [Candidatus Buchananbacteria bacterium]
MKNHPLIRTIYLYLFALIGLAMVTVGAAKGVDLGLKVWVFTQAEADLNYNKYMMPPALTVATETKNVEELKACADKCELTADQKKALENWTADYKNWQDQQTQLSKVDYKTQSQQREAASALSLIIVGLPLWLYHWTVIKKDQKKNLETSNNI